MVKFNHKEMLAIKVLVEYAAENCPAGPRTILGIIDFTGAAKHLGCREEVEELARKIEGKPCQ